MGKYGDIISKAREQDKAVKVENCKDVEEKEVSLTIKVALKLRRHWVSQAKAEGTSITKEVKNFLRGRFGEPDSGPEKHL